jgi:hypothetical protein
MSETEFDFDSLADQEIEVKYRGCTFYLLEADAATGRDFTNKGVACKNNDLIGLGDLEPWLVSQCLWRVKPGDPQKPAGERVPLAVVLTWEHKVVHPLFLKAVKIGELGGDKDPDAIRKQIAELQGQLTTIEEQEAARKNGSGGTATHSSSPTAQAGADR